MHCLRQFVAAAFVCGLITSAQAQPPNLEPGLRGDRPVPTITFEWASRGAIPAYYAITVDSMGRAAYRADEIGPSATNETDTGTPYLLEFTVSASTIARIFALTRQANYFNGNFENAAYPGMQAVKTLTYSEGPSGGIFDATNGVRNVAEYEYTHDPVIQQLATLFEGLSNTVEVGRRLDYLRRSSVPQLTEELRRDGSLAREGHLVELQIIAASLRGIAEDLALPPATRQDARDLLALAQGT